MPKTKRSGPAEAQKSRSRPYKARGKGSEGDSVGERDGRDDWEDALCPIGLESPHNAVLLVCSSHADGCHPYMCNTSDRHSNCLDQYQKAQGGLQKLQRPTQSISDSEGHSQQIVVNTFHAGDTLNLRIVDAYPVPPIRRRLRASTNSPEQASDDVDMGNAIIEALNSRIVSADSTVATRRSRSTPHLSREETEASGMHFLDLESGSELEGLEGSSSINAHSSTGSSSSKSKHLVCPLCRGQIFGWRVINAARKYFNGKARNCSHELCTFAGTYQELRVHARCEHPCARPCEVDPSRQRDWLRMERQREIGDVLSTIGASNEDVSNDDGHWWSYLLRRAASAGFRELIENINRAADGINIAINRAADGTNIASGSRSDLPLSRQPRHRRGVN